MTHALRLNAIVGTPRAGGSYSPAQLQCRDCDANVCGGREWVLIAPAS